MMKVETFESVFATDPRPERESVREVGSLEEGVYHGVYPFAFQTQVDTDTPCGRIAYIMHAPGVCNLFEIGCDADIVTGFHVETCDTREKWALLLDRKSLVLGTGSTRVNIDILASCMGRHRICIALREGSEAKITASHICVHRNLATQDWERGPITQTFRDGATVIYEGGNVSVIDTEIGNNIEQIPELA